MPKKRRRTLSWKILNLQNNRVLYYKRMASTYDELYPHFSAVAPYMRAHSVVSTSLMWRYAARHIHGRCVHAWTSSSTQTHETCVRAYVRTCVQRASTFTRRWTTLHGIQARGGQPPLLYQFAEDIDSLVAAARATPLRERVLSLLHATYTCSQLVRTHAGETSRRQTIASLQSSPRLTRLGEILGTERDNLPSLAASIAAY